MNRLEDLREWLLDRIDGSEETRGDDSLISHFINQIDAVPSEMGTIPDEERKKVMDAHLAATVEPKGCPTPGSCSAVEELADLKQRLLPQFQGRAQRAEHERDALLEQLIIHRTTIANLHGEINKMQNAAPSATGEPVAWMYDESGERMFGHPDGYRPTNAVPLYAAPVEVGTTEEIDELGKYDNEPCGESITLRRQWWSGGTWLEKGDRVVVLRPRMKGEPVDHGYDRTASLNEGQYVCTCPAGNVLHEKTCATRRPDARGPRG